MAPMVSPTGHRTRSAIVVLAVTSGYVMVKYGGLSLVDNILAALFFASLAFLAAIGSNYVIMRATAMGTRLPLLVVAILTTVLAVMLAPSGSIFNAVLDMITIFTGGFLVGYLVSQRRGLGWSFIAGSIWILAVSVIQYWDVWPVMIEVMKKEGNELVTLWEANPAFKTASRDVQDEMLSTMKTWVTMSARLSPAAMVMLPVTQLSIGFLWFLVRGVKDGRLAMHNIQFIGWKAAWQLAPVLIAAAALRLLGGESLQLIADNVIAILAIYYCITGLAMVAWFLRLLNVALWLKVLFYVFLTI